MSPLEKISLNIWTSSNYVLNPWNECLLNLNQLKVSAEVLVNCEQERELKY